MFFDLDGTLTDPKPGITRCIQHAMDCLGVEPPDAEELTWCIGPPLKESFVTLVGVEQADTALAHYRERFSEVGLYENSLYPGIVGALQTLRQRGAVMHIASSKPHVYVQRIAEHFELSGLFQRVFGAELDGTRSDKTDLLRYALQQTGCLPTRATMIGDRQHDGIGARNNQVDFVGVLYGYGHPQELTATAPRQLVESPWQIPDAVFPL